MGKINWTWELLEMSKMSSANRNRRNVETKEVDIAVYGNSVISVYAELTTDYGLYYTYIFDANSFNRTTNWGRGSSFSVYFSRLFFFSYPICPRVPVWANDVVTTGPSKFCAARYPGNAAGCTATIGDDLHRKYYKSQLFPDKSIEWRKCTRTKTLGANNCCPNPFCFAPWMFSIFSSPSNTFRIS